MQIVKTIKDKCKLCYACIKVCPSDAIKVTDGHAKIIPERCIACGSCYRVCPYDAIEYLDGKKTVRGLLQSDEEVIAICAPSISGEFNDITNYRSFVGMIKALGFTRVCEVSFGSDLVGLEYRNMFDNFKGKYFITANCPAVVNYVEMLHPDLLDNMAPLVSPMVATSAVVRKKYGKHVRVVYIGPCIAAKDEAKKFDEDSRIDVVLTFVELRQMFKDAGVNENNVEYADFDPPIGGKGSLFPISRGMFQAVGINENLLTGRLIDTNGSENVKDALEEFEQFTELKQHLDLFHCDGSCIMGPGTSKGGKKFLRRSLVINYTKKRLKSWDKSEWDNNVKEYQSLPFKREFENKDIRQPEPPDEEVQEVLKKLGKDGHESQGGCGSCGYDSCRDFAVAVCNGNARLEMCHTYAIQNKKDYIKRLKLANEKLANTKNALKDSESQAQIEKEKLQELSIATKEMFNNLKAGIVIADDQQKIVLSNESFIELLGDDAKEISDVVPGLVGASLETLVPPNILNFFSYVLENNNLVDNKDIHLNSKLLNISVFPIEKHRIVGAVFRNMYAPEVQREEIVSRITEVIERNLNMVQKIGFLLGEGASETERMLNSIIESYQKNKGK
ncbi:MAG: [Fe-Fe] hydrogenase large subunit C-terminal domain-containing protein [Salinivirgaceae bacterium]